MDSEERIDKLTEAVRELAKALVDVHGHTEEWQPVGSGLPEHEKRVRTHANKALSILRELDEGTLL